MCAYVTRKRKLLEDPGNGEPSCAAETRDFPSACPLNRNLRVAVRERAKEKTLAANVAKSAKRVCSEADEIAPAEEKKKIRSGRPKRNKRAKKGIQKEQKDPIKTKDFQGEGIAAYKFGKCLGEGGFGEVFAATRKRDNLPVAIKFVEKTSVKRFQEMNGQLLPAESYYQRRAHHPNVIQLLDVFTTDTEFGFVLERPDRCSDLFNIIERDGVLPENEARLFFTQILEATINCEEQGILHRDIKPENVIVDKRNKKAKLTDFGLSTEMQDEPFEQFEGTDQYCPPEYFTKHRYLGRHATVWQLGFLLVEMLAGEMPYIKPRFALFKSPAIPRHISHEAQHLISWMLARDPRKRPSVQQILCHPWITQPWETCVRGSSSL